MCQKKLFKTWFAMRAAYWCGACLCALLHFGVVAAAQDLRYLSHQAWSSEDGLPQNSVHSVLQTRDGFLWIATEGGLARFDGVNFQLFNHSNEAAIVSDDLCCLAEDTAGSLWVGTADGLVKMRKGIFRRFEATSGLPGSRIIALTPRTDGSVLVDTADGVALESGDRFRRAPARQSSEVAGAHDDAWSFSNDVVTLHRHGLVRSWDLKRDDPAGRVLQLSVSREGLVWIGMTDGVLALNPVTGVISPITSMAGNSVLTMFEDIEGNEWIGTETSGLHVLRRLTFRSEPSLANLAITSVAQTADRRVWIGTREDGLRSIRNGAVDTPVRPSSLTSPVVLGLAPSVTGGLWVGTPDGLNYVDNEIRVQRFTSANALPDDYIRSLAAAPDGSVWVGTRRGLVHLEGKKSHVFGSADGLGGDLVGSLLLMPRSQDVERPGGDLWVVTSGGLSRMRATGEIVNFTRRDGLDESHITALVQDGTETLWFATQDGGIGWFDGRRFRNAGHFGHESAVTGMTSDSEGFLWLRLHRGVGRIALDTLRDCARKGGCDDLAGMTVFYGRPDGMPSDEEVSSGSSSPWLTQDGELWFPTRSGPAITTIARRALHSVGVPLVLEQFLLDDVPQDIQNASLQLPFSHARFTLEYAALSFTAPSEVRYRIQLKGFDKNWIEVGNRRSATYTNLPAADYVFRVQAKGKDGVWSGRGVEFAFKIVPPFYRRWWFFVLLFLAVMGTLAALYYGRVRRIKKQFDAVLAERNRIAREIHDTLTQDFVGTSLQLDIISKQLTGGKVDLALEQVRRTRRLVTEGLHEARQSIWELRTNLSQESLPARLTRLIERDAPIVPRLKISGPYRPLIPRVEREVLRIAQEAFSNVSRHSQATDASVDLTYTGDTLILTIKDNGVGFSSDNAQATTERYGVLGMKERAHIIDGQLEIESKAGVGTTVQLRVALTVNTR